MGGGVVLWWVGGGIVVCWVGGGVMGSWCVLLGPNTIL